MYQPKFPLTLAPVATKERSPAQDLAFGRDELASAIRFVAAAGHSAIADDLRRALDALPPATVLRLGCYRCNGDVPLDQPDLVEDQLCRPCADSIDAAVEDRRRVMRGARRLRA